MISKELLLELQTILKEDYHIVLENSDLEKIAYFLLSYFSTLNRIDSKEKVL